MHRSQIEDGGGEYSVHKNGDRDRGGGRAKLQKTRLFSDDNYSDKKESWDRDRDRDMSYYENRITEGHYDFEYSPRQHSNMYPNSPKIWHNSERNKGDGDSSKSSRYSTSRKHVANNSSDKDFYILSSPFHSRFDTPFGVTGSSYNGTGIVSMVAQTPIAVSTKIKKGHRMSVPISRVENATSHKNKTSKVDGTHSAGRSGKRDAQRDHLLWLYTFRREVQKCLPCRSDSVMPLRDCLKVIRTLLCSNKPKGSLLDTHNAETHLVPIPTMISQTPSFCTSSSILSATSSMLSKAAPHSSLTRMRRLALPDEDSRVGNLQYTSTLEERLYLMAERKYGLRTMAVQYVASFLATIERCAVVDEGRRAVVGGEGVTLHREGDRERERGSKGGEKSRNRVADPAASRGSGETESEDERGSYEMKRVELRTFLAVFHNEVSDDYCLLQTQLVLSVDRLLAVMCQAGIVTPSSKSTSTSPYSSLPTFAESLREYERPASEDRMGKCLTGRPHNAADTTQIFPFLSLSIDMWMEGIVSQLLDEEACCIIAHELYLVSLQVRTCIYFHSRFYQCCAYDYHYRTVPYRTCPSFPLYQPSGKHSLILFSRFTQ